MLRKMTINFLLKNQKYHIVDFGAIIAYAFIQPIINIKDELYKLHNKFKINLSNQAIVLNRFNEGIISIDNKEIQEDKKAIKMLKKN